MNNMSTEKIHGRHRIFTTERQYCPCKCLWGVEGIKELLYSKCKLYIYIQYQKFYSAETLETGANGLGKSSTNEKCKYTKSDFLK